jgi:hypothetical protein
VSCPTNLIMEVMFYDQSGTPNMVNTVRINASDEKKEETQAVEAEVEAAKKRLADANRMEHQSPSDCTDGGGLSRVRATVRLSCRIDSEKMAVISFKAIQVRTRPGVDCAPFASDRVTVDTSQ